VKPPETPIAGTPDEWLARAKGRLALARVPLPPDGYLEDLCNSCHLAAELAIKAVYQNHSWQFPYIHDLDRLMAGLLSQGIEIPPSVRDAGRLTVFSVDARYPGLTGVTVQQYEAAISMASEVVHWAEQHISASKRD
jgi:HEPN domain-containing protein